LSSSSSSSSSSYQPSALIFSLQNAELAQKEADVQSQIERLDVEQLCELREEKQKVANVVARRREVEVRAIEEQKKHELEGDESSLLQTLAAASERQSTVSVTRLKVSVAAMQRRSGEWGMMHFEDGCGHDLRRLDRLIKVHEKEWWDAARTASKRGTLPVDVDAEDDENEAPTDGAGSGSNDLRQKQAEVLRFLAESSII